MTEGFFNAAYCVSLTNGDQVILKVAPPQQVRVMRYEKGIMHAEIEAMRRVEAEKGIPAPRVLFADESAELCGAPYFFMEKLKGASLNAVRAQLSEEQIEAANEESGRICAAINSLTCPAFGCPAQKETQRESWFEAFGCLLGMAQQDAVDGKVDTGVEYEKLWAQLQKDKSVFEEVTQPHLVHWDIWEGNLFVDGGKVTGIIDWERCLWADELMEVGFRTYGRNEAFLRGYGLTELSQAQKRRALWYDVYLLLLMSLETEYRHYESNDLHQWSTAQLRKQLELLWND